MISHNNYHSYVDIIIHANFTEKQYMASQNLPQIMPGDPAPPGITGYAEFWIYLHVQ